MKMKKCVECGAYTLANECPKCGAAASVPNPPSFSPIDKYGKYRRAAKKKTVEKAETKADKEI